MTLIGIAQRFGILVFLVLITGCADSSGGKYRLAGNVTFKGQPLEHGRIEFASSAGAPPMTGTAIENGAFMIPAEHGLAPGKYLVAIYASQGGQSAPADLPPGEAPPPSRELIPAKYNRTSNLSADVSAVGDNVFTFSLD